MTIRKHLLRIHRWTGVGLALLLVVADITGSLLAFHHEIDDLLASTGDLAGAGMENRLG